MAPPTKGSSSSADVMRRADAAADGTAPTRAGGFAWQVVARAPGGAAKVLARSALAPSAPWLDTPATGFTDTPQWRVFGSALGGGRRMFCGAPPQDQQLAVVLYLDDDGPGVDASRGALTLPATDNDLAVELRLGASTDA